MNNVSFIIVKDATQIIERGGTCPGDMVAIQARDGETAYPVEPGVLAWPSINPDAQKPAVWTMVKAKRDEVIDGGTSTPAGVVDSDELSRSNIAGATLAAIIAKQASQAFSIEWTLADNSVVSLDADQMIALGVAAMSHVSLAHDRARDLRSEIEATSDLVDLLTLDIETGWPA